MRPAARAVINLPIGTDINNSTNCHEERQFAHNEAHGRVQVYLD